MAIDKVVMTLTVFLAAVACMSLYGVISPTRIRAFAKRFTAPPGIWIASVIRLLLAGLLWFSSPACRTPVAFRVLALLVLAATLAIPVMGTARRQNSVGRAESWPAGIVRLQGIFGIALACFPVWSIWPVLRSTR